MLPDVRQTLIALNRSMDDYGEITWECLDRLQRESFPEGQKAAEFFGGVWHVRKRSVITRVIRCLHTLEDCLRDDAQNASELNEEEREERIPNFLRTAHAIRQIAWKPFVLGHEDHSYLLRDMIEEPDAFATVPSWQRSAFLRYALAHTAPGGSSSGWVAAARTIGMHRDCVANILREQVRRHGTGAIVFSCPDRVIRAAAILCPFVGFPDAQTAHVLEAEDLEAMQFSPWAQFDNNELLALVRSLLPSQPTQVINLCNALMLRFGIKEGLDLLATSLRYNPSFDALSWGATFFLHWLPDHERIPLLLRLTETEEPRTPRRISFLVTVLGSIEQQAGEAAAEALLDQVMRWDETDERRFCLTVSVDRFEKIAAQWYLGIGLPEWMQRRLDHARTIQTAHS